MKLPITTIRIKEGRRAVDENKVRELADSMKTVGLINHITVNTNLELIAGAHRIAAARLLGWDEIEAVMWDCDDYLSELAEIDENLMRNELHYLDEGAAYKRRDELLDEMGLRPKPYRPSKEVESTPFKTTEELAAELGVSKSTYKQAKQMARDILPEVQDAIKAADLPKTDALKIARLEPEKQADAVRKLVNAGMPHVSFNSGENEWYTPPEIIEAAREAMGSIDLDPASCSIANETVQATEYFAATTNGLNQKWHGNVWLNPPYASDLISKFADKVTQSYQDGDIEQAIILVNNATETNWFYTLISAASAVVFTKGRIKFRMSNGSTGAPLQGQALIYMGKNPGAFYNRFNEFGWGALL
jgi:ParB family chromosome partitioning protein